MKYLAGGLKKLINLKCLKLNLYNNNIGENVENLQYLGDVFE